MFLLLLRRPLATATSTAAKKTASVRAPLWPTLPQFKTGKLMFAAVDKERLGITWDQLSKSEQEKYEASVDKEFRELASELRSILNSRPDEQHAQVRIQPQTRMQVFVNSKLPELEKKMPEKPDSELRAILRQEYRGMSDNEKSLYEMHKKPYRVMLNRAEITPWLDKLDKFPISKPSAFGMFSKEYRSKDQHIKGKAFVDAQAELSAAFKALPESEKEKYEKMALVEYRKVRPSTLEADFVEMCALCRKRLGVNWMKNRRQLKPGKLSPYNTFVKQNFAKYRTSQDVKPIEVMKILSDKWKAMSDVDKDAYRL